jgi:hypothetical protein
MALPHALATGNDQPYKASFGPRLNCWKRQAQKKAAHSTTVSDRCVALQIRTKRGRQVQYMLLVLGSNPEQSTRGQTICAETFDAVVRSCSPTTQKKMVSQKTRSCI